ncbi:MAG: class I SAM-dependent methyltransferase [Solirubrobacteraceae bacterium]
MPSRDYHEAVWEALPDNLSPSDAPLRERLLLAHARRLSGVDEAPPRLLDIGCGEGYFAALLVESGLSVVAADVAVEPLRRLRETHPHIDLCLLTPDAPLPFDDSSFDAVWAGEVVEHVADTQSWLSELRRVLRSGGTLLLSTPDHGLLRRIAMALSRRRFEQCFDPRSDHLRFYTRQTLAALLSDFGFERIDVRGAGGLPGARRVLFASATRARF